MSSVPVSVVLRLTEADVYEMRRLCSLQRQARGIRCCGHQPVWKLGEAWMLSCDGCGAVYATAEIGPSLLSADRACQGPSRK
jgi:hypothetical protein